MTSTLRRSTAHAAAIVRRCADQSRGAAIAVRSMGSTRPRSRQRSRRPHHGRRRAGSRAPRNPAASCHPRRDERRHAGSADAAGRRLRRVPHSAMRKRIAERMVESLLHTAPHVTSVFEVDMGAVLAHRAKHRAEFEQRGASLTLTAYFLAACVDAIREVPEVNSRWTDDALEVFETIDIGVGTAVEGKGLVVPVVRDGAVAGSVRHRAGACRAGRAGTRRQADAGGRAGRDVHDLESRRQWQPARDADRHQPAAVGDPRRRQAGEARRRRRCRTVTTSRDPAALLRHADDRSSRDGWPSRESVPAGAGRAVGELEGLDLRQAAEACEYFEAGGGKDPSTSVRAPTRIPPTRRTPSRRDCGTNHVRPRPPTISAGAERAAADRAGGSCGIRARAACASRTPFRRPLAPSVSAPHREARTFGRSADSGAPGRPDPSPSTSCSSEACVTTARCITMTSPADSSSATRARTASSRCVGCASTPPVSWPKPSQAAPRAGRRRLRARSAARSQRPLPSQSGGASL